MDEHTQKMRRFCKFQHTSYSDKVKGKELFKCLPHILELLGILQIASGIVGYYNINEPFPEIYFSHPSALFTVKREMT